MRTAVVTAMALAGLLAVAGCTGDPAPEATPTVSPRDVPSTQPPPSPTPSPTPSAVPSPTPSPTPSPSPTPTPTPNETPTPSPTAADWTPPDPITDAYAQRVMQELFRLDVSVGRILRRMAEGDEVSPSDELREAVEVTRTSNAAGEYLNVLLATPPSTIVDTVADPPGPWKVGDLTVNDATSTCLPLDVTVDPSGLTPGAEPLSVQYVLVPADDNGTGWVIADSAPPGDPVLPCP